MAVNFTKDDDLTTVLTRAARAHRSESAQLLAELGLHPGQDALLMCLWEGDGKTQAELAEALGVEPPTVTKMVTRLESAGFVERHPHPSDRRATQVWLTDQGRAVRRGVTSARNRMSRRLTKGLSDRQQSQLRSLLGRVEENLGV